MRLKELNQHIDFPGHCDDWDQNTHGAQYANVCNICQEQFEDGQEFLELECTHVEHTECIVNAAWG